MFFEQTPHWSRFGARLVPELQERFADSGLAGDNFGLVVVVQGGERPEGFAYRGDWRCYPCSLVKAFHLVHALSALETGRLEPHAEIDRALKDMIAWSSNTATNYIIDLLTGTTGDTLLEPPALAAWIDKREGLNRFFDALSWPEFETSSITQKLMDDQRYGREAQYAGRDGRNLNALTPLSAARLMHEIFAGGLPLGPLARQRAQDTLYRDRNGPDAALPHYQVKDFLGGALPADAGLWSKAGKNSWTGEPRTSYFKHDLVRVAPACGPAYLLCLMTQGKTLCEDRPDAFPAIGRFLHDSVVAALAEAGLR